MGWNDESVMAPTVGRTMARNVRGSEGGVRILAISVVEGESREVGAPTLDSKARCNQGLSSVGGWDRSSHRGRRVSATRSAGCLSVVFVCCGRDTRINNRGAGRYTLSRKFERVINECVNVVKAVYMKDFRPGR